MTTFPATTDPVNALTRPDGTSRAHSEDHGNITDIQVNAKRYLRGDGTTEDAAQVALLQTAAAGKRCFWPPGSYVMPNGTGFTLAAGSEHLGAGRSKTSISVKDAYAFTGTQVAGIKIDGFNVDVRAGSVVGGAVKSALNNNNSWTIRHIYAGNVATNPNASFWLQGWIGNLAADCQGTNGQLGFYLDATGFSNSNSLYRCRAASNSVAGVRITGEGNCIKESIVESNTGYGVEVIDGARTTITANHFEDCKDHAIYTHAETAGTTIIGNAFWSYAAGAAAGTRFIKLVADGALASRNSVILANQFYNASVMVEIGAGVTDTAVLFNEGILTSDGSLVDSGTNTTILGPAAVKLPWTSVSGHFDLIGPASPVAGTSLLGAFSTSPFNNGFYVTEGGYPVFKTVGGDPGAGGELQNSTFSFWQDAADANKIKVRVRKSDGSYLAFTAAAAVSSAYTPTNVSTDRSYDANATTTDELADVLGTLIADLKTAGILS